MTTTKAAWREARRAIEHQRQRSAEARQQYETALAQLRRELEQAIKTAQCAGTPQASRTQD